ncbi:hypothetical protein MYX75_07730 [Acidobacteria bacterium AH-259-A15]|nr:hypothetical protein [Acidobacteria bacterium AH-259-A15]
MLEPQPTEITVRIVSCDAKIIGSLVGGCRITIQHRLTGEVLAQGLHLGGSGDTESIMERPHKRRAVVYGTKGSAAYSAKILLTEPTPVEIIAEGPLAYPQALERASTSTWLIPGESILGEGLILQLHGFIVDIMTPESVDVFHSGDAVHLQASIRLL